MELNLRGNRLFGKLGPPGPGAGGGDSCLFGDMFPIAVPWARIAVRLQAEYPRSADR